MDPKRWLLVCTVALMMTLSAGWRGGEANAAAKDEHFDRQPSEYASASAADRSEDETGSDPFLALIGAACEEDIWNALYNGKSLSDVAAANGKDAQALVDAQIAELTEQLRSRLISGSITWEQYQAYKAEVPDLIAESAMARAQEG
ncbi:hypothetical protein COLU111180_07005 [Cohnella lubricantis]|uniref:DUF4168 domain-containing protein n=1 Tax=Cohnella lubricantis TaxID=2163172 RepID=A0A841TJB8_9BACL|nr:hypothetical protein [Cohnella lubricantis]MBB6678601.1 hypothetical protein [Cohnella lubricantis]MBP2119241.1 hypothetical protein [Cohnella lubricantis]